MGRRRRNPAKRPKELSQREHDVIHYKKMDAIQAKFENDWGKNSEYDGKHLLYSKLTEQVIAITEAKPFAADWIQSRPIGSHTLWTCLDPQYRSLDKWRDWESQFSPEIIEKIADRRSRKNVRQV